MSSNPASAPSWSQWLRSEGSNAVFILRTLVGMLLALAIAFRFDLSSPGSAAVTVSIIALPQTGMVLEKSFYRLLGTLLGAVVTLLLLAQLVQHRNTFIVAVAAWIGLCTAASTWFRGFQAYAWLLCGYTTCLIGFPAFMDATHAFDIAVDRVTIVAVGIVSAGVVNAVILPSRSAATLVHLVRRSFIDFVAFLDSTTRVGNAPAVRAAQHQFSRDLANLESLRASSVFEDPTSRIKTPRLFRFVGTFMFASSRLQLLHRQLDALGSGGHADIVAALEPQLAELRAALRVAGRIPTTALEAAPVAGQVQDLLERWAAGALDADAHTAGGAAAGIDAARRAALLGTRILLNEAAAETRALAAVYADLYSLRSREIGVLRQRPRAGGDGVQAGIAGVRAALVVLVACAFWIATAWPEGFSTTLLAAVGCALFSATAEPIRAALQMCKGFAVGLPALVVCYSAMLPAAGDFYMLALALLPFLAFGAWLMTRPGQVLVGSGYFLMFLTGLNLTSPMSYDVTVMFNNALAQMMGIAVATLSLAVLVPANPAWRPQRAAQLLRAALRMARREPLADVRSRFESRVRDLTVQLIALRPATAAQTDERLGLLILEMGDAIIRLRREGAFPARDEALEASACLDATVDAVERQDGASFERLTARLDALRAHALERSSLDTVVALGILRLALADFAAMLAAAPALESAYAT